MKRVLLVFPLAAAVTGALLSQGAAAVDRPLYRSVDALEARMLARLNSVRVRRGLAPLRVSRALSSSAREHSKDMARNGFCGHDSPNGMSFWQRLSRFYGRGAGWRFWSAGENVLCHPGRLTAVAAPEKWLASAGHRANLLSPKWRDVGLGAFYVEAAPGDFGGDDVLLVTADFGFRN